MKAYLAARYSRHEEMQEYARQLEAIGVQVTSCWINGSHQLMANGEPLGRDREAMFEADEPSMRQQRAEFAQQDLQDVLAADVVISFTEQPRQLNSSRGGRHVEFGVAIAAHKWCMVVGYRENVFHNLPQVEFYETWPEAFEAIKQRQMWSWSPSLASSKP
jgi:nucleoside 2-deoxyribosyltransferase